METRLPEPDVLYVVLPPEPMLRPELTLLRQRLPQEPDRHLILDLSRVEIITSPSIGSVLLLQRQLTQQGHWLILCGARLTTRCILQVARLDALLEFAEDEAEALIAVRRPAVRTR